MFEYKLPHTKDYRISRGKYTKYNGGSNNSSDTSTYKDLTGLREGGPTPLTQAGCHIQCKTIHIKLYYT